MPSVAYRADSTQRNRICSQPPTADGHSESVGKASAPQPSGCGGVHRQQEKQVLNGGCGVLGLRVTKGQRVWVLVQFEGQGCSRAVAGSDQSEGYGWRLCKSPMSGRLSARLS